MIKITKFVFVILVVICVFTALAQPSLQVKAADGSPYTGTAISIPGTIQAENYNTGGEGVAYHDIDTTNQGGAYRSDGVDVEGCTDTGCGYNIGYIAQDEWWKYSVNVTTTGTYNIKFRVASNQAGAGLHLEINLNNNVTGHVAVPVTGGWQTWTDVSFNNVSITAGAHIVRLYADNPGFNINWISITSAGGSVPTNTPSGTTCNYPTWSATAHYVIGDIVKYAPNGQYYKVVNADANGPDGLDPTISTWYWQSYTCTGGSSPTATAASGTFVVSQSQFNAWFPNRNGLYTYGNFLTARGSYSGFAPGTTNADKQEAAAFFAHVAHETSYLFYVHEQNYPAGYYCATWAPASTYGCASGADYHGRGPLQLTWNYNYKMAATGNYLSNGTTWVTRMTPAVGADVWSNPDIVATDGIITWKTALWYWMNHGKDYDPARATVHDDIRNVSFGQTTNDINGGLECYRADRTQAQYDQMMDRANIYGNFLSNLGGSDGRTKTC